MNANVQKQTYSPHDLCVLVDLSYKTVLKLIENGQIPAIRVGRQWRVTRDSMEQLLKGGQEERREQ